MSTFLKRISIRYGQVPKYTPPPDWDGMWKLYGICTSQDKRSCGILMDIQNMHHNDKKDAQDTLFKLHLKAHTGLNLKEQFPKKSQCHPGHKFRYKGVDHIVWRLWLKGDVRVYFFYLENREIAIIGSIVKKENDLDASEKLQLQTKTEKLIDCYYSHKHKYI